MLERTSFRRVSTGCGLAGLALILATGGALAQANDARSAKTGGAASAAQSGDGGLKSRVDALEEQLVDMQVVVGTLESLAKNGGGGGQAFPSAAGGADAARIDSLETQVRALTSEVQQLSDQIKSMGGTPRTRSDIPAAGDTSTADAGPAAAPIPGFGSTTVEPRGNGEDAIGGYLNNSRSPGDDSAGSVATAALPAASDGPSDPKQAYETAYGYLLQRDYGSAESSFSDFLKKFPSDSLAGNAQYWLGETYFVRGQYKAAAGAFLKGYQSYGQSGKAPDSLLKLAMSLDRLGQKDAACSSFSELSTKFPSAPQSVKNRAQNERQRIGCQ
jgi:tol-pal system protein YbgF